MNGLDDAPFGFRWVRDLSQTPMPSHLRAALLVLWGYADYRSGECWPSIDAVAARIGCKRRSAVYALTELADANLISRRTVSGATTRYFLLPIAKGVQPTAPVQSVAPVQPTAWGGCNALHGGDATDCMGGVQPTAPELPIEPPKRTAQELPIASIAAATTPAPRDDRQAGEQLALTMPPQPKPQATEQAIKRRKDAEWLFNLWNSVAGDRVPGWVPCSRCDGACRAVLGRSIASFVLDPSQHDHATSPIPAVLEWAMDNPWWSGSTRRQPWGILQFFATKTVDALVHDFQRNGGKRAA